MIVASSSGMLPSSAIDPAVVGMSVVPMLSLSRIGMPCRGPRSLPGRALCIELARHLERFGIESADRVGLAVVCSDPCEVGLDELLARRVAGREGLLELGDRHRLQIEAAYGGTTLFTSVRRCEARADYRSRRRTSGGRAGNRHASKRDERGNESAVRAQHHKEAFAPRRPDSYRRRVLQGM